MDGIAPAVYARAVPLTDTLSGTRLERRTAPFAANGFSPGQFALLFAVLIFAAFPQVILGLQSFAVRDFGFFAYPLAHYQRECFWRGELPLWNPWNDCGVPFLAQWNTMPLYPPSLFYLVFPLSWALSVFCLGHLFWAGLGMYFLARRWTGSAWGAGIAGLVFGFNGFALNLLMWPSHIATFSWMPWVILATERAWKEGARGILAAALAGSLQMLAGGPETIFFTWAIGLLLWLGFLVRSYRAGAIQAALRGLWIFPATVALVSGICAAQLLPFLDLAAHSQREAGYADARWSMPSWGWANLVAPMVFGFIGKQGLFFQHDQYWTSSYYLGIGTLLLAGIALVGVRKLRAWFAAALALMGLLLATGDQTAISRMLRHLVPQLSVMTYPVKFVMLAVFAVPLLAAFGAQWLETASRQRNPGPRVLAATTGLLVLLGAILFWAWRFPLPYDSTSASLLNGAARAIFLALIATVLLLQSGAWRPLWLAGFKSAPLLLPLSLLVLMWLDVWKHEPQQNPTVPPWVYAPNLARQKLELKPWPDPGASRAMLAPAADAKFRTLILDDTRDNLLVKRLGFFADCNLLDHAAKVDGFFSLYPREIGELNSALYVSGAPLGQGLLDFLCVSQFSSPEDYTKWNARSAPLPLLTSGQQPVFMDDTNALWAFLNPAFDPRKTVILPLECKGSVPAAHPVSVRATQTGFRPDRVRYALEAPAAGLVVLAQTYYHWWRAYVDGAQAPLLRANYAFQGVEIPAGKHQLELRYEDRSFGAGLLISSLSLAACAAGWCAGRIGARRSGRHV